MVVFLWGCESETPTSEPESSTVWIPNVNIVGHGESRVGEFEFIGGEGVCVIGEQEVPTVIYKALSWPEYSFRIFQAIAPTPDNLHVLFFYSRGDTMSFVWHESYTDTLVAEKAWGAVEEVGWGIEVQPELLKLATLPNESEIVQGFTIHGDHISCQNGQGGIRIGETEYSIFPFQMVDCSDCVSGSNSSWLELHFVFEFGGEVAGFGVLYFHLDNEEEVGLDHVVFLDPVLVGDSQTYAASWVYQRNPGKNQYGKTAWH